MDPQWIGILLGYLLGSIPFGLVITKLAGMEDIRTVGSGNIGATNVLRTGRKGLALLTLLLDSGKGAIAYLLALTFLSENAAYFAGFGAFLGHCYPVWLKFKGGKGVATFLGTLFAANLLLGACVGLIWLASAKLGRISSLAALIAAGASPLLSYAFGSVALSIMAGGMAVLIFIRHKDNIGRLFKGEEPRIGDDKT